MIYFIKFKRKAAVFYAAGNIYNMEVILMMLGVTGCYTCTSLADRYAAHDVGFKGSEFTFLMCSSMSVFIALTLPFQEIRFALCWQSFAAVILVAVCKFLEFEMSMLVMKELSAFELKAWLGVNLFVSYFTEVIGGEPLRLAKVGCIVLTVIGLVLIVRSDKEEKPDYLKILLPLALYLLSKYGYSIVIKGFTPYVSSTVQLLSALVILAFVMFFRVKPAEIFRKNKKGAATVILARIPNAAGTLLENAVIAVSITSYSFIQPMILVTLFLIEAVKSKHRCAKEFVGSLVCIAGIALFLFV